MSEEFSRRDFLKKSAVVLGIGVIPALNEIQSSPSILRVKTSGETLTQIHGYITDEQMNVVPNALVNICGQKTTTDKQGQFCLSCSLPSKFGYRHLVKFKVSARGYHNLDLYLAPSRNGELTIYNCPIVEDRVFKGDGEFNVSLRRKI